MAGVVRFHDLSPAHGIAAALDPRICGVKLSSVSPQPRSRSFAVSPPSRTTSWSVTTTSVAKSCGAPDLQRRDVDANDSAGWPGDHALPTGVLGRLARYRNRRRTEEARSGWLHFSHSPRTTGSLPAKNSSRKGKSSYPQKSSSPTSIDGTPKTPREIASLVC
jgi:hypothetical protein